MLIVLLISCLSVLIVYLYSKGLLKNGLEIAFILLAAFFSIRYKYGNDYVGYMDVFNDISRYSSFSILLSNYLSSDSLFLSEIGWAILNYLFKPFGFPCLVAFLTCFEYYIYYKFIKTYVPRQYQWMAVFTLVLNPQILLLQLSMMRQSLAIVLLIQGTHYLIKNKITYSIFFALCALCAVLVHKSALFVLPIFIAMAFYKYIGRKIALIVVVGVYATLLLSRDYLSGLYALSFDNDLINNYAAYESRAESSDMSIGIGFFFSLIPFFLLLRYIWNTKEPTNIYLFVLLSALSYAMAPISFIESLLNRFVNYFSVYTIVSLPFAYYSVKDRTLRVGLIAIYALITLYSYYSFMTNPTWVKGFSTYHTILGII